MTKLMVVNSNIDRCGVHQFCKQIYRCLKGGSLNVVHCMFDNERNFFESLESHKPTHILINWHRGISVAHWLTQDVLDYAQRTYGIKSLLMPHDEEVKLKTDKILWLDPDKKCGPNEIALPRPVIPIELIHDEIPQKCGGIPVVGFSGFAFPHKRIELIKEIVGDTECLFRFHFPTCAYGKDSNYENFIRNLFPGIQIFSDFMTNDMLTTFLALNDINIFPYGESSNKGISSIIDNALGANKPFLVSFDSGQFRHLESIRDKVDYKKVSFHECLSNGVEHLRPFRERWNPQTMKEVIQTLI